MSIKEVNLENFNQEVLEETLPVLVDFWAQWCGPCKMITPILEDIAKDTQNSVKIVKINIDDNIDLAMRYAIRSIPTLVMFKKGKISGQLMGAVPKSKILEFIAKETA